METARHAREIESQGYSVMEDFLDPALLAEVRRALAP